MNKIKISQLKNIKKCPYQGYISQFNFNTTVNKNLMITNVYKDIIKEYDFLKLTQEQLKDIITEKLDDRYFLTQQEKEIEVITILNYFVRYIEYEKTLNRKILAKDIKGYVTIGNKEIIVKADAVFESKNIIELVKFKPNATKLSYKARKQNNKPENEIELFLMQELGNKIYYKSNKSIISSFYHFKGKSEDKNTYEQWLKDKSILNNRVNDLENELNMCMDKKDKKKIEKQIKTIKDVLYFNNSKGSNIITYDYNNDLSDVIIDLVNTELSFKSDKCKSSDCEFCSYSTLCNYKPKDVKKELKEVKELKKSNGEVKLTDAQKKVVYETEEGNYRINSVAGSGKSSTVVNRTIELLKRGYKPQDILMITFTNKGAEELREKISYWLKYYEIKSVNPKDLNIFTFNSFGASIIEKEWSRLGFTQQPTLASAIDVKDIIKELLKENSNIEWLNYKNPLINFPNAKGAFVQLLNYFNQIKSFNYTQEEFIENILKKEKGDFSVDYLDKKSDTIIDLYDKFNNKLKIKNLLQYQDQILYLSQLLEAFPELVEKYGYKHIIVDEYQDTDFSQVDLLHLLQLYSKSESLMVVGDNSQSVYGFRNTTPKNILNFDKQFDNVKDIFLLENFRSTPQICNVANQLDKLNTQRIDKDIISYKADGKVPQLLQFKTLENEYNGITNLIEEKINEGVPLHEIACIGRTKKELLEIQEYLDEKNIPNIVEVSERYIDNSDVQCIINLANFFKNNEQDYYLLEYLMMTVNNAEKSTTEKIQDYIEEMKNAIIKDMKNIKEKEEYEDNREETKIGYFMDLINPIIDNDIVAKSFIDKIVDKQFHTFNQFLDYLHKVEVYQDDTAIEKKEKKLEAVVLTTGHSSKGKEWSVVINSINKYKYNKADLEDLEETRRLLFVTITRAKDELYITVNTNQDKSRNKGKYCEFADELEGIERIEM